MRGLTLRDPALLSLLFIKFPAGFVAGGRASSNLDTVDKFAFSNDARSTLATGLSQARRVGAGFASQ